MTIHLLSSWIVNDHSFNYTGAMCPRPRAATDEDILAAAVRAIHPSPLAALVAAATEMARCATTPEEMANHLAFLQIDLSDNDFRRHALKSSDGLLAGY